MWFPNNYSESRSTFLSKTKELGFEIKSYKHPELGPGGEDLFIDIAIGGDLNSRSALVHLIGTHGVEAFAGSGIQAAILDQLKQEPKNLPKLIFVHPVNPYGMAWLRRVNHNNVDLNRNFRTKGFKAPDSSLYQRLIPIFESKSWSEFSLSLLRATPKSLRLGGPRAIVQAIAQGQYDYPTAPFYGGESNELEVLLLQEFFEWECQDIDEVWALEVHTGLGPWAMDSLYIDQEDGEIINAPMQRAYGDRVISEDNPKAVYTIHGKLKGVLKESVNGDLFHVIQEFGTYPMWKVMYRSVRENSYHQSLGEKAQINSLIKREFKECFFPNSYTWRSAIITKGVQRYFEALEAIKKGPHREAQKKEGLSLGNSKSRYNSKETSQN